MTDFQPRQPQGVPAGGQFSTSHRAESANLVLMDTQAPDLSSWTPAEVDTELYRLYVEHGTAMSRYASQADYVSREIARRTFNRGFRGNCTQTEMRDTLAEMRTKAAAAAAAGERPDYADRQILEQWAKAEEYRAQGQSLAEEMQPYEDEFERRGTWTRAFLVTNTGGHVHSSMDCSTCFRTGYDGTGRWRDGTRYHWVTDLSGGTEDEVIKAAGVRACTTCFRDAPTADLARPTTLFTPDEVQKAKDREARAIAKQERDAAKIAKALTADGSEFEVTANGYRERFKTEQAATTWAVAKIVATRTWNQREMPADTAEGVERILAAIAAKHDKPLDDVRAEIEKKVAAKIKRDGY